MYVRMYENTTDRYEARIHGYIAGSERGHRQVQANIDPEGTQALHEHAIYLSLTPSYKARNFDIHLSVTVRPTLFKAAVLGGIPTNLGIRSICRGDHPT